MVEIVLASRSKALAGAFADCPFAEDTARVTVVIQGGASLDEAARSLSVAYDIRKL